MPYRMTILMLALGVAWLFALFTAAVTAVLAWLGGATAPNAVLRGGIAFGGTLTLAAVLIGLFLALLN